MQVLQMVAYPVDNLGIQLTATAEDKRRMRTKSDICFVNVEDTQTGARSGTVYEQFNGNFSSYPFV